MYKPLHLDTDLLGQKLNMHTNQTISGKDF